MPLWGRIGSAWYNEDGSPRECLIEIERKETSLVMMFLALIILIAITALAMVHFHPEKLYFLFT